MKMQSANLRVITAMAAIVGSLVAWNGFGSPPPKDKGREDPNVITKIKPQFVLETGLLDTWGKLKTGALQLHVSPDGKYLVSLAHANAENVQVWDLKTKKKLYGIRSDIG